MLSIQKRYARLLGRTLQKFTQVKPNLFNFRCPYCGDSQKNENKARGYLFLNPERNGLIYKCHNCGHTSNFKGLLKEHDEALYKQYLADVLRHRDGYERDQRAKQEREEDELKEALTKKLAESYLMAKGAKRVSDLPDDHEAVEYLRSRCIDRSEFRHLYYTNEFRKFIHNLQPDKFERITNDSPAIIFPLLDKDRGTLNGVQFRNLDLSDDFRYMTIKFNRGDKHFGYHRFTDTTKPTFIVEGPIDSLMLPPGALAVGGSDLVNVHFEDAIYIFDNEPRNRQIVKKIEEVIARGSRVCLLPDVYYGMDLNDIVKNGHVSKNSLPELIQEHTSSGLRGQMNFSQWRKI